jgi:hypothetical protein
LTEFVIDVSFGAGLGAVSGAVFLGAESHMATKTFASQAASQGMYFFHSHLYERNCKCLYCTSKARESHKKKTIKKVRQNSKP